MAGGKTGLLLLRREILAVLAGVFATAGRSAMPSGDIAVGGVDGFESHADPQ